MIDVEVFSAGMKRSRKSLSKRTKAYLKEPTPDNVHDVRTAARRLLACFQLLPGNIRKSRDTRKYVARLEDLIKANAAIRDTDIILAKVSSREDSFAHERLVERLRDLRASKLGKASGSVSSLDETSPPRIRVRDLSDSALQRRFDKVNRKLESRLRERLPIVLGDPAKKRELHRLREDSRRLRYILNLSGVSEGSEQVSLLQSWQDILGLIHDGDIMIDYLQGEKQTPELQDLLRDEVAERNRNYEKFASMGATRLALRLLQQE